MEWVQKRNPKTTRRPSSRSVRLISPIASFGSDKMLKAVCTDNEVETLVIERKAMSITNNSAFTLWIEI